MSLVDKLVNALVLKFFEIGTISKEDIPVYVYGANALINTSISFLCSVVIAVFFNVPIIASLLFSTVFLFMRTYLGGFHFQSANLCFWFSLCLDIVAIFLLTKYQAINNYVIYISGIICVIVVFFIAPVSTKTKPLDSLEKLVYGKRARLTSLFCFTLSIILSFCSMKQLFLSIQLALFFTVTTALFGFLINFNEKSDIN